LENKFRDLANVVLDLEIRKKELNAQLLDLGHVIKQYQNAIDSKKEQRSKIEVYMLQLTIHHAKSKSSKDRSR
jgi:hypothetical protein